MIRTVENLYLVFYVAAMAFALLDGGFRKRPLHVLGLASASAAFVLHAGALAARWKAGGVIPSVNAPQLLELTVFFLMAVYFASCIFARQREILFFLTPISVLLLMTALMLPRDLPETKPYFTTIWFPLHIFLLVSGMALVLFSFIYSAIFIMQDHSLRRRKQPNAMLLPPISATEKLSKFYLKTGFFFFSGGMISSAAYGLFRAGGGGYRPGLLEAAALLSWIVLGAASFGWIRSGVQPRKRAFLVIVASSLFLFIFMGMLWH